MRLSAALAALALLAACAPERTAEPEPTPSATVAAPRTLVAADFDPATLGGRVAGMEVMDAPVGGKDAPLARMSAFVACAKDIADCDPAKLPADPVYTYVLTITPQAVPTAPEPTPAVSAPEAVATAVEEAPAELVRMTRPAPGFNGAVGFSRAEASAALGADDALSVTLDQDQLIWRVTGGGGWQPGKPITLWWQSTNPPKEPAEAYHLEYAGKQASVTAPFPAADKPVERKAAR